MERNLPEVVQIPARRDDALSLPAQILFAADDVGSRQRYRKAFCADPPSVTLELHVYLAALHCYLSQGSPVSDLRKPAPRCGQGRCSGFQDRRPWGRRAKEMPGEIKIRRLCRWTALGVERSDFLALDLHVNDADRIPVLVLPFLIWSKFENDVLRAGTSSLTARGSRRGGCALPADACRGEVMPDGRRHQRPGRADRCRDSGRLQFGGFACR